MATKITPLSVIGSIMTIAAFVGTVFAVDARYMTRAEAADTKQSVIQKQQLDRTETDLALINLEIQFLEEKISNFKKRERERRESISRPGVYAIVTGDEDPDPAIEDAQKRLEYLKQRRTILEHYQLELKTAK